MAKSLRSKVKRSFRLKKREQGVYAAHEAARLQRLNSKLLQIATKDSDEDIQTQNNEEADTQTDRIVEDSQDEGDDSMVLDNERSRPVSTHGPRNSRREEWRKSKGMRARPEAKAMNRQGGVAARRKAGRSKRRR